MKTLSCAAMDAPMTSTAAAATSEFKDCWLAWPIGFLFIYRVPTLPGITLGGTSDKEQKRVPLNYCDIKTLATKNVATIF